MKNEKKCFKRSQVTVELLPRNQVLLKWIKCDSDIRIYKR